MSYFLIQTILAAGPDDGEGAFWMQMLTLVILGAGVGIWSLVRTRAKKHKEQGRYYAGRRWYSQLRWKIRPLIELKDKCLAVFSRAVPAKLSIEEAAIDFDVGDLADEHTVTDKSGAERVLDGGMELLELDFLVGVVEKTAGKGRRDMMMRKFTFDELVRREQLCAVDSSSLKVYAMNRNNLYDKNIQCEAMKELAQRTRPESG